MIKSIQIFLYFAFPTILIFLSCEHKDQVKIPTKSQTDIFSKLSSADPFKLLLKRFTKTVEETDLNNDSTVKNEFRFFYFQPQWLGNFEFYKVNYSDSNLICKEFTLKSPDGAWKDSLLNSKTIKLTYNDFLRIQQLIIKSMFWNLEQIANDPNYLDQEEFVYESKRNKHDKYYPDLKTYHFVKRYAPSNNDFINLGQWIRKRAHSKDKKNSRQ